MKTSLIFILSIVLLANSIQIDPQNNLGYPQEEIVIEVHHQKLYSLADVDDTLFELSVRVPEENILLPEHNYESCSSSTSNEISICTESRLNPESENLQDTKRGSAVYLEQAIEALPAPPLQIPAFESFRELTSTANIIVPAIEIYACPPTPLENCTPKFQQVCAAYQTNCPNKNCQETLENECIACSNPDIHTYTPGACPPTPVECDTRPDSCDDSIEPVCGSTFNCVSNCKLSFRNKCHACLNPQIASYVPGTCPSEAFPSYPITFCESPRETTENKTAEFVCSYFNNCTSGACSITSLNSQTACANPLIDYYTSKKCAEDFQITEESASLCPSGQPDISCENNFDPVCAHFNNGTAPENSSKTSLNQCLACNNTNVEYIVSGACKNDQIPMESFCDINNRPMFCAIESIPVCGRKIDSEEGNCFETFSSDCFACGKPYISSYLSGECPSQGTLQGEKIYCDPKNRPKDCSRDVIKQVQPVCGVYTITLNGATNKTFESSCAACENTEVQYYFTNACTQDSEESVKLEELTA